MIRFDNISKRYPSGLEALKRVNFELEAGEKWPFLPDHRAPVKVPY